MKKIYTTLVLLFAITFTNAQVVSIPDVNFKNKLIELGVDANNDGFFQQAEVNTITNLDLTGTNTADLTGINSFSNLQFFTFNGGYINNLDLSNLQNLQEIKGLNLSHHIMNLQNCINLKKIELTNQNSYYTSGSSMLDLSGFAMLEELILISRTNFSQLNLQGCINLKKIDLSGCGFESLEINNLPKLEELKCASQYNDNVPWGAEVFCGLLKLEITNAPLLKKVDCNTSRLSRLDLSSFTNLEYLDCSKTYQYAASGGSGGLNQPTTKLTDLKLSGCVNLKELYIQNTGIENFNFNQFPLLQKIDCSNTKIEVVDVNNCTNLTEIKCANGNVEFLKIKNTASEVVTFLPNSNLKSICADASQITAIQETIDANNLNAVVSVSNDCSIYENLIAINIPDINLKNKLIALGLDTNNDTKIQYVEAATITNLDISNAAVVDVTGLDKFTNLQVLNCSNNQIADSAPIMKITSLQNLNCSNNVIDYFDFSKLPNLQTLNFSNNKAVFLDLSKNSNLQTINASSNEFRQIYFNNNATETTFNFSNNPKLHTVVTDANQVVYFQNLYPLATVSSIGTFTDDFVVFPDYVVTYYMQSVLKSEALNTIELVAPAGYAEFRIQSYAGLDEFKNLENFTFDYSIGQGSNPQYNMCIEANVLESFKNLEEIDIDVLDEGIPINDYTNFPKLKTLKINAGFFSGIGGSYSHLGEIDLNNCHHLETVTLKGMFLTNLTDTKIFINNGANETLTLGSLNDNLFGSGEQPHPVIHICADDFQTNALANQSVLYQGTPILLSQVANINTYCSFVPAENHNTLSGNALYDNENDGCDTNDDVFEFLRLNLTDGTNSGSTFTNFEGDYSFYMGGGNFTMTAHLENPTYFNVSPTSIPVNFADNNNNTSTQNFCITSNGTHNDVEVVLAPITPARPGFDAEYSLVFKNKGNQPLSGTVSVTFDDATLDFVNANPATTNQQPSTLTWDYSNLLPFENRSITFTLNVNSPMETPAVNNGDILAFTANITPLTGDDIPEDNTYTLNQTVVGSFDPNDIYCLEGAFADPALIGEYLHYNVRFENTGTYEAENIVVTTTINAAEYDLNSLQVLNASHDVYTRMKGDKVEFIFERIHLAGSPSGGHGNIIFKMKSLNSLQINDDVTLNANIFFDYNFPIETNDANTIFAVLSNGMVTKDVSVKVYPNPAKETVTISAKNVIKSISIYDAQGRIVQFVKANELEKSINITNLSNGIYILDIVSENGRMVEKLVKN